MPCRDGGPTDAEYSEEQSKRIRFLTAALCAVLTSIDKQSDGEIVEVLWNQIDWKEAGIKRAELEHWWREHKREDARRRERERQEIETEKKISAAIAKLTPEERELLGLDDE